MKIVMKIVNKNLFTNYIIRITNAYVSCKWNYSSFGFLALLVQNDCFTKMLYPRCEGLRRASVQIRTNRSVDATQLEPYDLTSRLSVNGSH